MIVTDIDKWFGGPGLEAHDREGWQSAQRARAAIKKRGSSSAQKMLQERRPFLGKSNPR